MENGIKIRLKKYLERHKELINLKNIEQNETEQNRFAQGMNFYKMFWVFFIGSFLGVVVETIWCILTKGHYESRVGLIYGPFNPVYGLGSVALTVGLHWLKDKSALVILAGGAFVGSTVEYICSWLQETLFGTWSWDYSNMPFNLHGRINLECSFYWGILSVIWMKELYPLFLRIILKIPNKIGKPLTWILCVFMVFNLAMSGLTVNRWVERRTGRDVVTPEFLIEYFDTNYSDERMDKIYQNTHFEEKPG